MARFSRYGVVTICDGQAQVVCDKCLMALDKGTGNGMILHDQGRNWKYMTK